jgi:hypothetical protein
LIIKINCGGGIFYAFNYGEKEEIFEECRKHNIEPEVVEVKL